MLNMRFVVPDHLIDINGIDELNFIKQDKGSLTIGAMTRQMQLAQSSKITKYCPILQEALRFVGHFQTRNRGTFGGSLCHLDPSAEMPAIASLLGAELTVKSAKAERTIAFDDWSLAYMTPNVESEEVLVSVHLPLWQEKHGHAFVEFSRRHGDFAIVGVGVLLTIDKKQNITKVAITVAGANVKPQRLHDLEHSLIGQPATDETFLQAGAQARNIEAFSDAYITKAYRQRLSGVLVERALKQAQARI
jgi:carbon-monoxide dehydrogenase medium subunit